MVMVGSKDAMRSNNLVFKTYRRNLSQSNTAYKTDRNY